MFIRAIKSAAPKSLLAFALFAVIAASAAPSRAQAGGGSVFRVPFEFTVGGVRLPAGEYTVRRTSQAGMAYFVRSTDGRSAAAVTTQSPLRAKGGERPLQLTFDVHEGQYFLSEVWADADGTGAQLRAPRAAREMAKRSEGAGRVVVAAFRSK